ncbi:MULTISPECIES: thermonuclease family protein [Paenibacillus]|uniref:Thermonuclease n=1 Tax=Paenibacillus naphthalenovorans TaxID=162209 RepID=A0A0U2UE21_9BACL|nr:MULTISPECIES: thermonuclease family protein [Paenibacillus]ALS21468.1 thermonuclease [Paenibacillus naphthalenovorans]GCL71196.1 hypothetical protein PN4B1_11010 [Paenibacillus naphthalenovorans]
MKKWSGISAMVLAAAIIISGCGNLQAASTPASPAENKIFSTAKVTGVVDGDTIKVELEGKEETVRMILVDTPETVHPNKPVQPFGPEASALAKKTLEGKEVKLERDVSQRDRYGRILAYVYVDDQMFNEVLLEKGLARVSVFPPDVKYVDRFREIQKKAQKARLGIWSIEDYASDHGYDDNKAQISSEPQPSRNEEVYYGKCAEVQAAGKAPLHRGDPGYRSGLDRDGDGIACE